MDQELKLFQMFLKDKSMPARQKTKLLREYAKSLGMVGAGKKSGKILINDIVQGGGSWGSFVRFFKRAGNAVANAGKTVYNKAVKPVANAIAQKPLSTVGKIAGLAGMLPTPFSPALKTAGSALGAVGSAIGKGQSGRGILRDDSQKPIMIMR